MAEKILFDDYENIQAPGLSTIPANARVVLVLGAKQSKLPTALAVQAQRLGERFTYIRIDVPQPNGVDFCIAFHLGEYLARNPDAGCVILSRDKKSFDPLVQHLSKKRGLRVRRVNSQSEAFRTTRAKSVAAAKSGNEAAVDDYERVLSLLQKDNARPRKRKGLEGKLKSWLPQMQNQERAEFLKRLFADGHVHETNDSLTYR